LEKDRHGNVQEGELSRESRKNCKNGYSLSEKKKELVIRMALEDGLKDYEIEYLRQEKGGSTSR